MVDDADDMTVLLARLSPKEKELIGLRFGLKDGIHRSHEEISVFLGLSLDKVKKTERLALTKLGPNWKPPPPSSRLHLRKK